MPNATLGSGCEVGPKTIVGYEYADDTRPAAIGNDVIVRAGSTIYADVILHDEVQTGHDVLIREQTEIGSRTVVGSKTVIEGYTTIGENVSLQTGVYVPTQSTIEDRVFVGPCAVMTNDPYPIRQDVELEGPTLKESATIGANATLNPGVTVGERAFVASGSVVTEDVPEETLAIGIPAEFKPLPKKLKTENNL